MNEDEFEGKSAAELLEEAEKSRAATRKAKKETKIFYGIAAATVIAAIIIDKKKGRY